MGSFGSDLTNNYTDNTTNKQIQGSIDFSMNSGLNLQDFIGEKELILNLSGVPATQTKQRDFKENFPALVGFGALVLVGGYMVWKVK